MISLMNNPDAIMNDKSDQFIKQCIKNWAAEQHPPEEVRTRVMHAASPFYLQVMNSPWFSKDSAKSPNTLASYRSLINKRTVCQGRAQLWAWNMFTMTSPRFIA